MTAPIPGSSPRPSTAQVPVAPAAPAGLPPAAAPATADAVSLLTQIMPVAQLALWEAWDSPLQLIAVHFGQTSRPALPLEPAQLEAGCAWDENVYPSDREKLHAFLGAPVSPRPDKSVDYRLIVTEGELLWVRQWLLHRGPAENGRRRLLGMIMPIPEQKHLEWECLRVSERECNRIGQELHDDLCQVLAGLSFMMHVLAVKAGKTDAPLGAEIHELNTQVQAATDRVRSMAHGLFPAQLNFATLRDALNQLARQTRTRFAVEFDLDLPRKLPAHSPEQTMHVYRIAQEAVSNAVRHGGAKVIRLVIAPSPNGLQVSIEDDGTGFPASSVRPEGIGMHVMQYRTRVLGGSVRFKNLTPRGASVQLMYPVSQSTPAKARKHDNLL